MTQSYRDTFQDVETVTEYESRFGKGTYGKLLSEIEFAFLDRFLQRFPHLSKGAYLDFACGTGRILSHVEAKVGSAVGFDVAQPMLDVARTKLKLAQVICKDITAGADDIEGAYDLISSFRFFQNAEPSLRRAVMRGLAARLRNADSRLVFNVQGILNSHKVLPWLARSAASAVTGRNPGMRALTMRDVLQLVSDAGLQIDEVYGYDVLSGKAALFVGRDRLGRIERRLAGTRLASRIGGHRIFVARRA